MFLLYALLIAIISLIVPLPFVAMADASSEITSKKAISILLIWFFVVFVIFSVIVFIQRS